MSSENIKLSVRRAIAVLFLVVAWYVATRGNTSLQSLALPSPADFLAVIESRWRQVLANAFATLIRVLVGFVLGGVAGLLTGLAVYASTTFRSFAETYIELIRPIPAVALSPFFIFWFGLGETGQILLIALTSFLVITVSTYSNARSVDRIYLRVAMVFGASRMMTLSRVVLPAILPPLEAAARVAAAGCWSVSIAAEYLGAQGGLGYMIRNARITLQTDTILVAVVILGILSYTLDVAVRSIFARLTSWMPREAGAS